jgi:hypothetical protein
MSSKSRGNFWQGKNDKSPLWKNLEKEKNKNDKRKTKGKIPPKDV